MKKVLPLFIMVDACGWEIIKNDPFGSAFAPNRTKLTSVFGYSSTCVPSILSGRYPDQHHNWCYFVHDPDNSPFRALRLFRFIPKWLGSRRIVRKILTRLVKKTLGFKGYFDLYNIPFSHIHLYDFTEKKSPLKPGGMNRGENIFDFLEKHQIDYFVSDPNVSEEQNAQALSELIRRQGIDFAFMYWAELDGLLHRVGNQSSEIPARLRRYEDSIEQLLKVARENYDEVRLYVFSDHGMANCVEVLDLKRQVDNLDLKFPSDYVVVYDSTMARFWFKNDRARQLITACLHGVPQGRILPTEELKGLRAWFENGYFGELIFLVKEGVLIVPSHMGERPLTAMHGYHPSDPQSFASLLTNLSVLPLPVSAIPEIHDLMVHEARRAKTTNSDTSNYANRKRALEQNIA